MYSDLPYSYHDMARATLVKDYKDFYLPLLAEVGRPCCSWLLKWFYFNRPDTELGVINDAT